MNEQVLDNFVNWLKQNRPGLEESSYRQYRSGVSSACRIWQQQPQDITEMTGAELARIFSAAEKAAIDGQQNDNNIGTAVRHFQEFLNKTNP